jgi:hypothetical protein
LRETGGPSASRTKSAIVPGLSSASEHQVNPIFAWKSISRDLECLHQGLLHLFKCIRGECSHTSLPI